MSGTFKTIGSVNTTCTVSRCVMFLTRWNDPRVGQNLLMSRDDRLSGDTGTPSESQRSESGCGILGVKGGRGMLWWSVVVVTVLSSRIPDDGCSLTGHRDYVSYLVITANIFFCLLFVTDMSYTLYMDLVLCLMSHAWHHDLCLVQGFHQWYTTTGTRVLFGGYSQGNEWQSTRDTKTSYTGWRGELEHLKIETRLMNERFVGVMGECVMWTPQVRHGYSK